MVTIEIDGIKGEGETLKAAQSAIREAVKAQKAKEREERKAEELRQKNLEQASAIAERNLANYARSGRALDHHLYLVGGTDHERITWVKESNYSSYRSWLLSGVEIGCFHGDTSIVARMENGAGFCYALVFRVYDGESIAYHVSFIGEHNGVIAEQCLMDRFGIAEEIIGLYLDALKISVAA